MNLYEKFLDEWREDAVMGDDLFDEARKSQYYILSGWTSI